MYDAIQHYDPAAGARLAKLSAERHMCRVLIVGCPTICIAHAFHNYADWRSSEYCLLFVVLMVGLVGSVFLYLHLAIRQRRALLNNWDLIQYKIDQQDDRDSETPEPSGKGK